MAPNPYTASYQLASAMRRGQIPVTSDRSFGPDDLLALMSEELQTYIVALMESVREEWFVVPHDQLTVANQISYPVPPRAIGSQLRQVLLGTPGGTNLPNNFSIVQRIEPRLQYGGGPFGYSWSNSVNSYSGYIFQDTAIQLIAPALANQTLRMMYFRRPSRVVPEDQCGLITAIDRNALTITLSQAAPTSFTSSEVYDFVKGRPGFDILQMDATATVAGDTLTVTSIPTGLVVGDYVALAGTSPIPQIPVELQPVLTQRLVVKVLEALGDPKVTVAKRMLDEMARTSLGILTPRDEGSSRYLTNFSGPGWNGRFRGRY